MAKKQFWKIKSNEEIVLITEEQINKLDWINIEWDWTISWTLWLNEEQVRNIVNETVPEVVDNLTTDDSTKVLSAKQGKALKDLIDNSTVEWLDEIKAKTDKITVTNPVNLDTLKTDVNDTKSWLETLAWTVDALEDTVNALDWASDVSSIKEKTDKITVTDAINLDTLKSDVEWAKAKTDKITVTNPVNLDNIVTRGEIPDVSNLATKDEIPDTSTFATKTELSWVKSKTDKITVTNPVNLDDVVTWDEVDTKITNQLANFDKLDYIIVDSLPTEWWQGVRYLVKIDWEDKYNEYIYINDKWNNIGTTWSVNLDNYYNKTEVDTALSSKANASTTYTKTEVDTALSSKANTSDIPSTEDFITKSSTNWLYEYNWVRTNVIPLKCQCVNKKIYQWDSVWLYSNKVALSLKWTSVFNLWYQNWTKTSLWKFTINSSYSWRVQNFCAWMFNKKSWATYKVKFTIEDSSNNVIWTSPEETVKYYQTQYWSERYSALVSDWKASDNESIKEIIDHKQYPMISEPNNVLDADARNEWISLNPWTYTVYSNITSATSWWSSSLYIYMPIVSYEEYSDTINSNILKVCPLNWKTTSELVWIALNDANVWETVYVTTWLYNWSNWSDTDFTRKLNTRMVISERQLESYTNKYKISKYAYWFKIFPIPAWNFQLANLIDTLWKTYNYNLNTNFKYTVIPTENTTWFLYQQGYYAYSWLLFLDLSYANSRNTLVDTTQDNSIVVNLIRK